MGRKLYVGNLAYSVRDSDLEEMFGAHGSVQSAQVIMDRDTGRSKGFGFVEMTNDAEADTAIAQADGACRAGPIRRDGNGPPPRRSTRAG